MDLTTIEHMIIAAIITLVGFLIGDIYAGAAAASMGFMFREITQAEYRWIEKYGNGIRANMPWYAPFTPRCWDIHSIIGMVAPTIVAAAVVCVVYYFWI